MSLSGTCTRARTLRILNAKTYLVCEVFAAEREQDHFEFRNHCVVVVETFTFGRIFWWLIIQARETFYGHVLA